MTFREAVPKQNVTWRAESLALIRSHATRARRAADGLKKPTAFRSLVQVLAISFEEAAVAFDAAWERELASRPELLSGLDADVSVALDDATSVTPQMEGPR